DARLVAAGFDRIGADRRMVLVDREPCLRVAATVATAVNGRLTIDRHPDRSRSVRDSWAADAALVLGEAFDVDPLRRIALETDVLACVARRGCALLLL